MAEIAEADSYVKDVRDLRVFKKAYDVSLIIYQIAATLPKFEQYDLSSQMRRACKSVCANLAEGFYKQVHSSAEFRRFISMAIGSCGEMQIWLKYCIDLAYIKDDQYKICSDEYEVIAKMLQNLRSRIKDK